LCLTPPTRRGRSFLVEAMERYERKGNAAAAAHITAATSQLV
jgi:hypothetical protein